MKRLLNQMRMQAEMAAAARASVKVGLVSGYDHTNYSVKVTIQPEGIETGWIPLTSPWVGAGWGMFCTPSIGDMIEVQFEQGGSEAAFACMRFFNDTDRPLDVQSGEFWLVHKLGAFVKLTNDGNIVLHGKNVRITVDGSVSIDGNASITGNLTVGGGATGSFSTPTGDTVTVQDGIITNIF